MTSREKVGWRVPSSEWEKFTGYVDEQYGGNRRSVGREVERAMAEWVNQDEYAPVEDLVDRLVRAAGRTPQNLANKKSSPTTPPTDGDTTPVGVRVDSGLKDEFLAHTKRNTDERPGLVLARALRERRFGGRSKRLLDKLERIGDDAEALLAEVQDEDSLSVQRRRTIAICHELGEQFTQSDLENAIESVAGGSGPTIQEYTDRVLSHLEYVEHPSNPDLYISKAEARTLAAENGLIGPEGPAIYRKEYSDLSREEKIHGLRVEGTRRAWNRGKAAIDATAVEDDVFAGYPTPNHVKKLMDLAAKADGFHVDERHKQRRLLVNLDKVTDDDLLSIGEEVAKYERAVIDGRQKPITDARPVTDGGQFCNEWEGDG